MPMEPQQSQLTTVLPHITTEEENFWHVPRTSDSTKPAMISWCVDYP